MISRRNFFRAGAGLAASLAAAPGVHAHDAELKPGGAAYSAWSGVQYKGVPTVCTLCVSRCPAIAYTDDGRLAKMGGNPQSIRTGGRLCARGQAAVEQVYDPDRILYPMKRSGPRGSGQWQRVSWDVAMGELAGLLKSLRDEGVPERFVVQHGWLSAGTRRLLEEVFMPAYGSASLAGPESLGRRARLAAHRLTWGGAPDHWDLENARYILNFGSNLLEAHTNYVALARRFSDNAVDNRVKMVTFDVRLSNTAARSDEWLPIRPGTDLAVALAMCHVVMEKDLYRGEGERFLEYCRVTPQVDASVADKVAALKAHLADFTPEWAEGISGVPAARIEATAVAFASTRPACVISQRGASAHHNGVDAERALQMLAALTGNVDVAGSRAQGVMPRWVTPRVDPETLPKRLAALDGPAGAAVLPFDGVGHLALGAAKDQAGPAVLMWIGHNPAYANGNTAETVALLKDEKALPHTVAVTPFYDETAALADLILPDTTFLESWDIEEGVSANQIAEFAIRQPAIEPMGEARDVKDVLCELAAMMGISLPVRSGAKFVEEACRQTPDVKTKARGLAGMKKAGVWSDKSATPAFGAYLVPVAEEELGQPAVLLDDASGVYWNWRLAGAASEAEARSNGYSGTAGAWRGYAAQKLGGAAVAGFRPYGVNKSGLFELYSTVLAAKGLPPLPVWSAIPEHQELGDDKLVLVTFKVNVHAQGRSQNARWLDEIQHDTAAWLNPATAAVRDIRDGDRIRIGSALGDIVVTARVTHSIAPGVVALPAHGGHREYGRFASGKRTPTGVDDVKLDGQRWWKSAGSNANDIIPKSAEPVSGQQRWMDTVVTVTKASA
ncbi:molybdopterin-containing oxidoreductase family protein [Aromatoleum aromaticum]|uniref:molybdopterin-containing oxidoreductase family protein n=1 Tax=Aromatoleum aromaticum TaxID=551760 RepID=UPI00145974CD|nr:molybdopterin-dependent oxidoreductase [Aromatoleum aromaticum]NMG53137.1 molybdopterin-dependent oxidoreductase [Aromatoleum aromaticum]